MTQAESLGRMRGFELFVRHTSKGRELEDKITKRQGLPNCVAISTELIFIGD